MRVVAKIGTSSLVDDGGEIVLAAVDKLAAEAAMLAEAGHEVVIVTSAAIAAGLPPLGYTRPGQRPRDPDMLRAASTIGQISLMSTYRTALAEHGLVAAQLLLAPTDFWYRNRYLKSRATIQALLRRGAVPVVNENDAVADEEIRFGDNDRLAALVAHLIEADRLVMLTDTAGLFTGDPRVDTSASLIEEIVEFDKRLEEMAGGPGSSAARGGMASKLAAAKIATWSGVETTIARAERPGVLLDAVRGETGVGTVFRARSTKLSARKLWIAFARPAAGRVLVDRGARVALVERQRSLLAAGITAAEGDFAPDDAVEVVDEAGEVFAKGLIGWSRQQLGQYAGLKTTDLPPELKDEVIHRDDLVLLPA